MSRKSNQALGYANQISQSVLQLHAVKVALKEELILAWDTLKHVIRKSNSYNSTPESQKSKATPSSGISLSQSTPRPIPSATEEESTQSVPLTWKLIPNYKSICPQIIDITKSAEKECNAIWSRITLIDSGYYWTLTGTGCFTVSLRREDTLPAEENYRSYLANKRSGGLYVVNDLSSHPTFSQHASVSQRPHFRFYAGVPVVSGDSSYEGSSSSWEDHCLGLLFVADTSVRDGIAPEQALLLHKWAQQSVSILQENMLNVLGPLAEEELPRIYFDPNSPSWPVLGMNKQWEVLTGVLYADVPANAGLLDIMTPLNQAEIDALQSKIDDGKQASLPEARKISLPSIMTPKDKSGCSVQLVLALKPALANRKKGVCKWMAEVHAYIQADVSESRQTSAQYSEDSIEHVSTSVGSGSTMRASLDLDRGSGELSLIALGIIPPPRLSSLRVKRLIDKGSYGSVYEGVLGSQRVAVKIQEGVTGCAEWQQQSWFAVFESMLALSMSHSNIVRILDFCSHDDVRSGKVWTVLELADEGSLTAAIKNGYFNVGRKPDGDIDMRSVLETARDIALGMQYLHCQDVLHADLSSNNVLLFHADNYRGFTAKVTDFGLARMHQDTSVKTTKTFGTIVVQAPEVLRDGTVGKRRRCKNAWDTSSFAQIIWQVVVQGNTLIMPKDTPRPYADLAMRCMAGDKDLRPTFDEILVEINKMLEEYEK